MAYQVLARKYRPQRFSDVVGQDHVTRTLRNALEQGRVAHGYIFSGHRGIGKTTIARILAMALNCRNSVGSAERPTAEPCGACDSCQEIRVGNSVDMMEIDAATNRGIDEIRELRDATRYSPARDRYKIYLLDEAHQITDAAFNALLKTLEEPPSHVVFMMATTQPEDIPPTIRSRCQHFSFHAVTFQDIFSEIAAIAQQEEVVADDEALALLAEAGDGSMRDALSIMDQAIASAPLVNGHPKIDAAEIRNLMGTAPNAIFEKLLEWIAEGQSAPVMEEINRLLNAGHSPSQLARQLVRYLRDCLMAKLAGETTELLQISSDERARVARSAAVFSEEDLTRFLQVMLRTFDDLNYRQEQRFHLELGLLKLVHFERLLPLEQILSSLPGAGSASRSTPGRSDAKTPVPPHRASPQASPTQTQTLEAVNHQVANEQATVNTKKDIDLPVLNDTSADLDSLRDAVAARLNAQGHNTAAGLLSAASWSFQADGVIQAEVSTTKTMLGLAMNAEASTIAREALRGLGVTKKLSVVPSNGGMAAAIAPPPIPHIEANSGIQTVALNNPLVQRAQELFKAEVRSVLDLREGARGRR